MKKSSRTILSIVILLAGFGLGYFCASLPFEEGNSKGDITKVSKYNKSIVSPQASAFQEKIMNDPAEMERAKASLAILGSRMNDFDKLVEISVKSCEGIDELKPAVERLESISKLSANARQSANAAVASFNDMVKGVKNAPADYESASQKLSLAYIMVDRQMTIGKEFVAKVDSYLNGKKVEDNIDLALSRDLWAGYCAGEAILNGNNEELAFWKDKGSIVTPESLAIITVFNGPSAETGNMVFNGGDNFANIICSVFEVIQCGINNNNGYETPFLKAVIGNSTNEVVKANVSGGEMNLVPCITDHEGYTLFNVKESMETLQLGLSQDVIGVAQRLNLADFALTCTSVNDALNLVDVSMSNSTNDGLNLGERFL